MKKRADGRYVQTATINGKRHYFYSTEPTEKRALKDIQRQMIEFEENISPENKLYADVAAEWEKQKYNNIEYTTMTRYKTYVRNTVDVWGNIYITDISTADIDAFLQRLALTLSNKTVKDQFSVIKMIFKYAKIMRYIKEDPCEFLTPPKGKKAQVRDAVTEDEMNIVRNSINCTFGLLAYFLMYTGLRKGEALALRYSDIDFDNKLIRVRNSVYFVGNNPHIKSTKTAAGQRDVILLDCLAEKLPHKSTDEYIFNYDGNLMPAMYFTRHWQKYQKETGLNITAHQLRHTFATILFEADVSVKDAQNLMGHSDISVTQNIYTHIRQKHLNETANKLNNYISGQDVVKTS